MKSSVFLAATGAMVALASPLMRLDKRILVTDIVTEVVTVTVTDFDGVSTVMYGPGAHVIPTPSTTSILTTSTSTSISTSTSTSTTPPIVIPTSTSVSIPSFPPTSFSSVPPVIPTSSFVPQPSTVVDVVVASSQPPATTQQPAAEVEVIVEPASSSTPQPTVVAPQSSSVAPQAAAASPTDFASTAVYHHNIHRFNHSAPAISWGQDYADYAQQVAESCVFAHNLGPGGGGYGQNIAMWASSDAAESLGANTAIAQAATDMWYNGEVTQWPSADYGMATPDMSNFEAWGHFSQLVWVGSTQVGCYAQYCAPGTMVSGMGAWFSVCNYYPAGNVGGEYGDNVLQPENEPTVTA